MFVAAYDFIVIVEKYLTLQIIVLLDMKWVGGERSTSMPLMWMEMVF